MQKVLDIYGYDYATANFYRYFATLASYVYSSSMIACFEFMQNWGLSSHQFNKSCLSCGFHFPHYRIYP